MSQLPWGGRPTSPVDDPDNTTGPGQDAPAGPDPNAEKCDCTCPDYNELPWLPPGDGPGGDPDYTGTYYRLIRCRDDAEQPAWVQTNEFAAGDVLLIETDGIKTCFYVDSTEVPNDQVQDTNVIRPADVEADFLTCTACRTSGPPAIVDPDPPLPPILPTSYAQLAFCSDDTLAPLWTPVEVFGVPVAEDLTKIYEIEGVCYYISNNIQPTPGGPLMPVFGADVFDDCIACLAICGDCNPDSGGASPNSATVTNVQNDGANCSGVNTSQAYSSFTDGTDYCLWLFETFGSVAIVYVKNTTSAIPNDDGSTRTPGQWLCILTSNLNTVWSEPTTGFTCNPLTRKISGSHTFSVAPWTGTGCQGTPTVVIAP